MFVSLDQPELRFSVQSCRDAVLGFASEPEQAEFVHTELVLGADNNLQVRIKDPINDQVYETVFGSYLDCNSYRDFWVKWNDSQLSMGVGHEVSRNLVITWSEFNITTSPIRAVSFTPSGGTDASYKVFPAEGTSQLLQNYLLVLYTMIIKPGLFFR